MEDITIRWKDHEDTVHSLTAHDIGESWGQLTYRTAETACGIATVEPVLPAGDPISCEACISREGDDALQEVERILARASLWRTPPARVAA